MHPHHYDQPPPPGRQPPPPAAPPRPSYELHLEREPFGAWAPSYYARPRPLKWPLLGFVCTVLLLVGLAVLLRGLLPGDALLTPPQGGGSTVVMPKAADPERVETTVPRAPLGDGTTLHLSPAAGRTPLPFQTIYQQNQASIVSVQASRPEGGGLGTGIIMSADGYIITNAHVIEGCDRVYVLLADNTELEALLVGYDSDTDLAVLKIPATGLPPVEFGDSDALQVGDVALALGNPLGDRFRGTMTDGIISALNRDVVVDGVSRALIQTTAALNSGNSGGALLNELGQVVGVTSMKMTSSYDTIEGLGFAIPTATVKTVVDTLIAEGHVSGRPTIGITVVTLPAAVAEDLGAPHGVQVRAVEKKSDAQRKGLRVGDVITAANGIPVTSSTQLNAVKQDLGVGDILRLSVCREKKFLTIEVELVEKYTLE